MARQIDERTITHVLDMDERLATEGLHEFSAAANAGDAVYAIEWRGEAAVKNQVTLDFVATVRHIHEKSGSGWHAAIEQALQVKGYRPEVLLQRFTGTQRSGFSGEIHRLKLDQGYKLWERYSAVLREEG